MNDGVRTLVSSFSGSRDGGVRSRRRREAAFLVGGEEEKAGGGLFCFVLFCCFFLKWHKLGKNSAAEW